MRKPNYGLSVLSGKPQDLDNMYSWLTVVASNQAKNWFRSRSRLAALEQSADSFMDESSDQDREMDREKMRNWLDSALTVCRMFNVR